MASFTLLTKVVVTSAKGHSRVTQKQALGAFCFSHTSAAWLRPLCKWSRQATACDSYWLFDQPGMCLLDILSLLIDVEGVSCFLRGN